MNVVRRLGALFRRRPQEPRDRYAVRFEPDGSVVLTARGDTARLVPVVLDLVRDWSGPVGVAAVTYGGPPQERTAGEVPRPRALEGLLRIRDLIGTGGMDLAVFSEIEAMSVYVDRFGILEGRGLGDGMSALGARLAAAGFRRTGRVSAIPPAPQPADPIPPEAAARILQALDFLELSHAPPDDSSAARP